MNQTLLLTGGNGFLGTYISNHWKQKGVTILSLGKSLENDIRVDLAKSKFKTDQKFQYVIHAAGKAHSVPRTNEEAQAFYDVNFGGTENLLESLEICKSSLKGFVYISSVSVYGLEEGVLIDEDYPLKAKDPYGKSKILAESSVSAWCKENNIPCSILRPSLIVGKDALGNLKAMIDGIKSGRYANISGGRAKKSMVLADDVASFSKEIIQKGGTYNLSDGLHPTFSELSIAISEKLHKKRPANIPYLLAKPIALAGDVLSLFMKNKVPIDSKKLKKIMADLTFDSSKALEKGWNPKSVLEHIGNCL